VHQHAKFCTSRSNRCVDMANSRFFKMATLRHIGFLKFEILTVSTIRRANMTHHAKFRINRSNHCRDMAVFRWLAAVRHLGFVIYLFGPSTKCISVVSITVQNLV